MNPTLEHMARWLASLSKAITRDDDLAEARNSIIAEAADLCVPQEAQAALELYRKLAK